MKLTLLARPVSSVPSLCGQRAGTSQDREWSGSHWETRLSLQHCTSFPHYYIISTFHNGWNRMFTDIVCRPCLPPCWKGPGVGELLTGVGVVRHWHLLGPRPHKPQTDNMWNVPTSCQWSPGPTSGELFGPSLRGSCLRMRRHSSKKKISLALNISWFPTRGCEFCYTIWWHLSASPWTWQRRTVWGPS